MVCLRRQRLTFVGVVLPLWAWYFLDSSGITSVCVVFMSVGVVLPLWAGLYLCRHGVTPGCLFLPLRAWFDLCGRAYAFVGVVLPL